MNYEIRARAVQVTPVSAPNHPPVDGKTPLIGDFVVTILGKQFLLNKEEFFANFAIKANDPSKVEAIKLAQQIIDNEVMVDDDNAEIILHDAVEIAEKIKRMLR